MPETEVVFFSEQGGSVRLLDWLDGLPPKVQDKAITSFERLAECGHELRRPGADFLRDDIYELRIRHGDLRYRMLYFFHGQQGVLSHGFIKKQRQVPPREIDRAIDRHERFKADPEKHTYRG